VAGAFAVPDAVEAQAGKTPNWSHFRPEPSTFVRDADEAIGLDLM